ncbi:MAG: zinc ABC transporter substrate-binding protein, partial [Acidimicrobiales bacterium]
ASASAAARRGSSAPIVAVGAENEYANVLSQIGGKYVKVSAIESNPNTDPHEFEASTSDAEVVASARLIVQNGLGYDSYMNKIESASSSSKRVLIDVQSLLGLPNSSPNPHLWYSPQTMPKVARAIDEALAKIAPNHKAYFSANLATFDRSLSPWTKEISAIKRRFGGDAVAVTEPVGDYLLTAAGLSIATPWVMQADVMNGVDPSPQAVNTEEALLRGHVKVFLYNQQVTDTLTENFLSIAKAHHVPIVGVYETMPVPGYTYQSWMLAEATALYNALAHHTSTKRL